MNIQAVLLCGGTGSRLWPLSRQAFPKQFLPLLSKESLFQQAVGRLRSITPRSLLVVGSATHQFLMREQLDAVGADRATIMLEPEARNTAPALTLAALQATAEGDDPVLLVTPADQLIEDGDIFQKAVQDALTHAMENKLVVLGIEPGGADTGYGYIRADETMQVKAFIEKPDLQTATRYVDEGGYFWNSGMFVMKASIWLQAIEQFAPTIYQAVRTAWGASKTAGSFVWPQEGAFLNCPADSIDYAVMEQYPHKHDNMVMVPLRSQWADLGSWQAVHQAALQDEMGNSIIGDAISEDCENVMLHSSHRLIAALGVKDVTVVETADAVLLIDNKRTQEVRSLVETLKQNNRAEHLLHHKVHRPWGWYDNIDEGPGFKVKRIMVRPGASLSLQKHAKRAEHWVVVSGVASVQRGEEMLTLSKNQSTYIPIGMVHRLSNEGKEPLEIIEVQSGDYLAEDDIERLDDDYQRHLST